MIFARVWCVRDPRQAVNDLLERKFPGLTRITTKSLNRAVRPPCEPQRRAAPSLWSTGGPDALPGPSLDFLHVPPGAWRRGGSRSSAEAVPMKGFCLSAGILPQVEGARHRFIQVPGNEDKLRILNMVRAASTRRAPRRQCSRRECIMYGTIHVTARRRSWARRRARATARSCSATPLTAAGRSVRARGPPQPIISHRSNPPCCPAYLSFPGRLQTLVPDTPVYSCRVRLVSAFCPSRARPVRGRSQHRPLPRRHEL